MYGLQTQRGHCLPWSIIHDFVKTSCCSNVHTKRERRCNGNIEKLRIIDKTAQKKDSADHLSQQRFQMKNGLTKTKSCDFLTFRYDGSHIIFELKASSSKETLDRASSPFDVLLEKSWQDALNKGLFRFAYDPSMPCKRLSGKYGFLLEVNGQRHSTRRPPPVFSSTRHPFDPTRFHFGRAPVAERLFRISGPNQLSGPEDHNDNSEKRLSGPEDQTTISNGQLSTPNGHQTGLMDHCDRSGQQKSTVNGYQNGVIDHQMATGEGDDWVMINVSPIGRSHVLLLPRLSQLLPQRLDRQGLQMMLDCLLLSRDSGLRGMCNSLGALASVNHYHLHLYRLHRTLYVETAGVRKISEELYELTDYPARAFVFEVNSDNYASIASRIVALTELILDQGLAFNLVATRGWPCGHRPTRPDLYTAVRVLVFPRRPELPQLPRDHYQLASCELIGHISVTSEEALDILTEASIAADLRSVTGPAFEQLRPLLTGDYLRRASGQLATC